MAWKHVLDALSVQSLVSGIFFDILNGLICDCKGTGKPLKWPAQVIEAAIACIEPKRLKT